MSVGRYDRLCAGISEEAAGFAEALSSVELDRPSTSCPAWTAGELIVHLEQALGWAAGLVETRATAFVPPAGAAQGAGTADADWTEAVEELAKEAAGKQSTAELTARALGQAQRLSGALREAGPDGPVWTTFGPHRAAFWASWAAMEAAVHRVDAELLAGRAFELDPELSYDSVGFWLTALGDPATAPFYDPRVANLRGAGETLRFLVVDPPAGEAGHWLVTRTPDGPRTAVGGGVDRAAGVTVRGTAAELLLLLKRRVPAGASPVAVSGDAGLLEHWLENALT